MIILQIADGVLTYVGMSCGLPEGNPVAVWFFDRIGVVPTLLFFKLSSILAAYFLYFAEAEKIMVSLSALTIIFAILPWIYAIVFLT